MRIGSKNISIPEDVYGKPRKECRPDESFGEAIDRLLGRRQLSEFWGMWNDEMTERARAVIKVGRERNADRLYD